MAEDAKKAKAELERRRRALVRAFRDSQLEESELIDDRHPEWSERSATQRLADVVDRIGEREVDELRAIIAALQRIQDGSWGRCATCGEPIAPERLRALPEAQLCVSCAPEPGAAISAATVELDDERLSEDIAAAMLALEQGAWGTCVRCGMDLDDPEQRLCADCLAASEPQAPL